MADRPLQDVRGSGMQQSRDGGGRGCSLSQERVCAELRSVVARAEESATATAEAMETDEQLPDVWELTYRAALALARGAAVDELLGNSAASMRSYVKVGPFPASVSSGFFEPHNALKYLPCVLFEKSSMSFPQRMHRHVNLLQKLEPSLCLACNNALQHHLLNFSSSDPL